ncbi:hypothetical protein RhiJN_00111 [Ceratobasidium sp. AG-Ba]|nr:hypothetical protein RhiJN_00111 [Ceratobasidium sp. AG-Ba]QRW01151.1 hypothetical protein RhiLY_00148 [Ceratobasidium sp. AG-Ba]
MPETSLSFGGKLTGVFRFKDLTTFDREVPRRSGQLSPDTGMSETEGETTKSEAGGPKAKSQGGSANKARGKSSLDTVASATEKILKAKKAADEAKQNVALERLALDKKQAKVANKLAIATFKIRSQNQKRKWVQEQQAAKRNEAEAKRRRINEDTAARETRILNRIAFLNKCASETTNPALLAMYEKQVQNELNQLNSAPEPEPEPEPELEPDVEDEQGLDDDAATGLTLSNSDTS